LLDHEGPSGGGTYLSSALDFIEEEGESADVILAFTDGYTDQSDYDRLASENVIMVFDTYRHWIYARHYIEQSGIRTIIADDTMAA
jgi:predicted metal-dependent peptidase